MTLDCFMGAGIFFSGSCRSEQGKIYLLKVVLTGVRIQKASIVSVWVFQQCVVSLALVTCGELSEICFLLTAAAIN